MLEDFTPERIDVGEAGLRVRHGGGGPPPVIEHVSASTRASPAAGRHWFFFA